MPETPDFDRLSRELATHFLATDGLREGWFERNERRIAEQLRLMWNARGAADLATLDTILSEEWAGGPARVVTMKTFDHALRKLNR